MQRPTWIHDKHVNKCHIQDIIKWIVTEHHKGTKNEENAMSAKQKCMWKDKLKFCTNCKCKNHNAPKCWEEGPHANAPHWVKQGADNASEDKRKRGRTKVYATKEDSGSKSAAKACRSPKLHDTHDEKVSVTWDDITLHRTHPKKQ